MSESNAATGTDSKPAVVRKAKNASTTKASSRLRVTLVRSMSGRLQSHRACVMGLGLRRMHHSVVVDDTPENRGMINKVSYMLKVEETAQ